MDRQRPSRNPCVVRNETRVTGGTADLPFSCSLELHAQYGSDDMRQSWEKPRYLVQVSAVWASCISRRRFEHTFCSSHSKKLSGKFSPSTMYADYPISRELLHWESQSNTSMRSDTGQNLINHRKRGYTILIFVRATKRQNGITSPFTYLGPAERETYEHERPISIVWKLRSPMPALIFEENRRGG